jgi:hypothetical protein
VEARLERVERAAVAGEEDYKRVVARGQEDAANLVGREQLPVEVSAVVAQLVSSMYMLMRSAPGRRTICSPLPTSASSPFAPDGESDARSRGTPRGGRKGRSIDTSSPLPLQSREP